MIENLERNFSRRHIEARLRLYVWSISEDCKDRLNFFFAESVKDEYIQDLSVFVLFKNVCVVRYKGGKSKLGFLVLSGVTPLKKLPNKMNLNTLE